MSILIPIVVTIIVADVFVFCLTRRSWEFSSDIKVSILYGVCLAVFVTVWAIYIVECYFYYE